MRITALVVLTIMVPAMAGETLNVVPWPRSAKLDGGTLALTADARIAVADESLLPLANILVSEVRAVSGLQPTVTRDAARPGDLSLALQAGTPSDDYRLSITDR